MIIAIMGLIGAGKSSLVKALQDVCGYKAFLEPTSESEGAKNNPFLDLYYEDAHRWAYAMQTFLLFERHKMTMEAYYRSLRGEVCILDSCCESDRAFALVQKQDRYFTPDEFVAYTNMYKTLQDTRPKADLVVWLDIMPKEVIERIQKRSRDCEAGLPIDYLDKLYHAYQEVLSDLEKHTKVVRINARPDAQTVLSSVQRAIIERQIEV